MELEQGLDTGGVYAVDRVDIGPDETAGELTARLVERGTRLLVDHVDGIPDARPAPQRGEPTYAAKVTAEEFRLDWSRPSAELARTVRAGNPRPGAWTTAAGRRLKVLRAAPVELPPAGLAGEVLHGGVVATGKGGLQLVEVQPEGKRPTPGAEWARGFRGGTLGEPVG